MLIHDSITSNGDYDYHVPFDAVRNLIVAGLFDTATVQLLSVADGLEAPVKTFTFGGGHLNHMWMNGETIRIRVSGITTGSSISVSLTPH